MPQQNILPTANRDDEAVVAAGWRKARSRSKATPGAFGLLVSPALDVLVLLHYNTHIICTIGVKVAQVYLKYANPNITMLRKQEHLSWFGSS